MFNIICYAFIFVLDYEIIILLERSSLLCCKILLWTQLFKQNSGFLLEYNYSQSDLAIFAV